MKKWKLIMLAAIIEWHWLWIKAGRNKGNTMLEHGVPLSSPKLLRLSRRITRRGMKAMRATQRYEDLCGLTAELNQGHRIRSCDRTAPIQDTPPVVR